MEIARFRLPDMPRGYHAANLIPANSTQGCFDDGGYTYQGCMTQYYSVCYVGGAELVNVTKYTERWTMIDPSGVYQLKGPAGMRAGVFGGTNAAHCGGKSGIYGQEQTKTISGPKQLTTYTEYPSWAGAYVTVEQSGPGYQCGNAYVQIYNYIHPTQTWTFAQPDVCQGYPGLPW